MRFDGILSLRWSRSSDFMVVETALVRLPCMGSRRRVSRMYFSSHGSGLGIPVALRPNFVSARPVALVRDATIRYIPLAVNDRINLPSDLGVASFAKYQRLCRLAARQIGEQTSLGAPSQGVSRIHDSWSCHATLNPRF